MLQKAKAYDARIKTMISKHALVRSDSFVHELECISQRINGEENEAPAGRDREDPENDRTNMNQIAKIISVSMAL